MPACRSGSYQRGDHSAVGRSMGGGHVPSLADSYRVLPCPTVFVPQGRGPRIPGDEPEMLAILPAPKEAVLQCGLAPGAAPAARRTSGTSCLMAHVVAELSLTSGFEALRTDLVRYCRELPCRLGLISVASCWSNQGA